MELLQIYQKVLMRSDVLLGIFKREKQKRGRFTYRTMPQANREPAQESMEHAKVFFKNIFKLRNELKEQ